jgi:hypothetical protein
VSERLGQGAGLGISFAGAGVVALVAMQLLQREREERLAGWLGAWPPGTVSELDPVALGLFPPRADLEIGEGWLPPLRRLVRILIGREFQRSFVGVLKVPLLNRKRPAH